METPATLASTASTGRTASDGKVARHSVWRWVVAGAGERRLAAAFSEECLRHHWHRHPPGVPRLGKNSKYIIIIDMHIIKYTQALFIRQWVFLMILDIIVLIDDNNVCPARSLLPCHYKALCIWQIMFNSIQTFYLTFRLISFIIYNFEGPNNKRQRFPKVYRCFWIQFDYHLHYFQSRVKSLKIYILYS